MLSMQNKEALVIFIKTPLPHLVKTRLQPQLSAGEAALIYSAFIRDLDQRFRRQKSFDHWYAVAPENFDPAILKNVIDLKRYFSQEGADLGERMIHTFNTLFSKGYAKIALIGSDIPTLSISTIRQSFRLLDGTDGVIGPGVDGGYYLIALNENYPFLFRKMPWSTSAVYQQTMTVIQKHNLRFSVLPTLSDIDTIVDLRALYNELKKVSRHLQDFPAHTWKVMQSLQLNK
jgi:rSAM/selenodomain-associated transferase 1